jgi:class 3 adenylate cyclase/tetratricopeptide (TPR) repeat protein
MSGGKQGDVGMAPCASCGAGNPITNRFCFECGGLLTRRCAACGEQNPARARFCGGCGTALGNAAGRGATAPLDADARLAERIIASEFGSEGERKQVTVLFADVVGSTELIRDLDAEDSVATLAPAIEAMRQAVTDHEGVVNRVQGDGITALFGAPVAHEDHAVRACLAALDMRDAVAGLPFSDLKIRVGINTGGVVVRSIRNALTTEYEADGPTVHLAARMEQLATPGTVRATTATVGMAEGVVEARALEPTPVKGFGEAVEQWELLGAVPAASRWEIRARRGLTAFTGREAELGGLRSALAAAGRGDGQVVAIVAEAGMGKSRLLHEFLEHHTPDGWTVRVAGARPDGRSTPFEPIRTLLRAVLGARAEDGPAELETYLGALLGGLGEDLDWAHAPLATLLDLPVANPDWSALEPSQRRRLMIDAFRTLALRRAEREPLVLVFEDLHWVDAETEAALDALVDSVPASRVLLVVSYRPEYVDAWVTRGWHRSLRLTGLGGSTAVEFLRQLVGPGADLSELVATIVARTEGRPLFGEEIVRDLAEDGSLVGVRSAYRLARPIEEIRIPASVQAVLAARIDRLEPETKRVLQVAAVIGREVPRALLASVLDADLDALDEHLVKLKSSEFLYERIAAPEPGYLFKHALTRDVAYESLLRERRRELHERTLRAMEKSTAVRGEQSLEMLGHHAFEGECWEDAVQYLRRAGNKATVQSAYVEARALLERALKAIERRSIDDTSRSLGIDARMDLRPALGALGRYPEILQRLDECEMLAVELGDESRRLAIGADKIHALYMLGRIPEAIAHGQQVVEALAGGTDRRRLIQGSCNLAMAYLFQGSPLASVSIASPLMAELRGPLRAERLGTTETSSVLWSGNLCGAYALLGDFERSVENGAAAREIAAETGKPFDVAISHYWSGFGLTEQGRAAEAEPLLRFGLSVSREHGATFGQIWGSGELSRACLMLDRVEEARELIGEAVALAREGGVVLPGIWYRTYACEIAAATAGEVTENELRQLLAEVEATGAYWFEPLVCRLLARLTPAGEQQRLGEVRALLHGASERCRAGGRGPEEAHIALALAQLDEREGRLEEAQRHAGEALNRYTSMEMQAFAPAAARIARHV